MQVRSWLCMSCSAVLTLILLYSFNSTAIGQGAPNVLFIAVDDLRPELGCYGESQIYSPNIDRLANEGTLFLNSYCNIPVCGASRASILTGLRPTFDRFKNYFTRADEDAPNVTSLPLLFKSHGYTTISNGKISHTAQDNHGDWDEVWRGKGKSPRDYLSPTNIIRDNKQDLRGPAFEIGDTSAGMYRDEKMTAKSIADLQKLKAAGDPFFLAVGYVKPHLPFNAPKKYWDLYPEKSIHLPENRFKPADVPSQALHTSGELRHYQGIPKAGRVHDSLAISLIRGYYACVSYTDALVGELLQALEELDLAKNTIVVLWGDHGWNLYEHGMWCKHSNYRTSTKAPLILRVPEKGTGIKRAEMVEFVDIYPTLQELAGLADPGHLEGASLVPLLSTEEVPWKTHVTSVWKNGFSHITPEYAYTKWLTRSDSIIAEMLFDHRSDPGENVNLMMNEEGRHIVQQLGNN